MNPTQNIKKEENRFIDILEINYGIACRIGNTIYINKNLHKNQELYNRILKHELDHSSEFLKKDILMDISNSHLKGLKLKYYYFILTNPLSLVEFLPGWFYNGRFVLAPLTTFMWIFGIALFWMLGRLL